MKISLFALFLLTIAFAPAQKIKSKKVFTQDSVYISLENPFLAPVEFRIKKRDSVKTDFRYMSEVQFEAKQLVENVFVLPLSMVQDTASIDVNKFVEINGKLGNPKTAKHDDSYLYTLPFKKGKSVKIMQSFGGKFSHFRKHSKYAIDFTLQIGDTVTAARDGLVVIVKEDSQEYGRTYDYADKGNKVIILHKDGTFANYVHLDYNGALVEVGDSVKVGQNIGISGLTGFTTKPHLHFVVLEPRSVSVPMYFKGIGRKKLKPGKRYRRKK